MLGVFKNGVVNPPQELYSPASSLAMAAKSPQETLKDFLAANPTNGFSLEFADKGFLAYASPQRQLLSQQRGENHRLEIITILPDERRLFREPPWVEFEAGERGGGVPVVAIAQAMDQVTNAKLVEDSWRCGVRAVKWEIVEADEIVRCLEMVMDGGDESREMRKTLRNGGIWRGRLLTTVEALKLFCSLNDVYCIFLGSLNNLCTLNKQYGLSKVSNEDMLVIEAYCTLRDRSPIPAHRVLKDLEGDFGFVIYDHKAGVVFAANSGGDKSVNLYWGIAADGSVMISDNVGHVKASCGKSFGPFPAGCMYHSEKGLMSFEHPMKKMKAMPRVDSEGALCGAYFAVDAYSKANTSMPRVDSAANWG
ncbi:hypothetical protein SASPL_154178 [Salvia splendens]|uniref:DUF3700 domain-containing protein n=1 Tax=Salvia splendens TaxID=180675 RepID=A0A8X8VZN2_SALSN|nr:hypothetical protein SASPL_154178 [Salvia splendens]